MIDGPSPWTPVALSRDIPAGTTRAITLNGAELVAWRSEAGHVRVWEDRCPHRGMRLSYGFVRGERLACLYHGWEYATSGSCQRIPAHPDLVVPPSIRARDQAALEADGLVFVGSDPAAPPPALGALVPLASMHVACDTAHLGSIAGGRMIGGLLHTTHFGTPLYIGWHTPSPDETMLHVLMTADTVPASALASLRALRAAAELEGAR